jgi:hypothetical protein
MTECTFGSVVAVREKEEDPMTLAVDQPHRRHWSRREAVTSSGIRARVRPLGAAEVGLLSALVGAWGGICVFVGPYFGYRPTSATTWQWTTNNWLLHLLPGAVAFAAGLMILSVTPARRAAAVTSGSLLGLAALLLIASGAWFVIGPALWPTFQSSPAFATGTTAWTSFWNQLGANLGPGVLLAVFGGMALKASFARPAVAVEEPAMAPEAGMAGAGALADREAGMPAYERRGDVADREAGMPAYERRGDVVDPGTGARGPDAPMSERRGDMMDPEAGTRSADSPMNERGAEAPVDSQPAVNDPGRTEQAGGPASKII